MSVIVSVFTDPSISHISISRNIFSLVFRNVAVVCMKWFKCCARAGAESMVVVG